MKKKLLSGILIIALLIGLCPAYTFEVDAKTENGNLPLEGKTISIMGDSISTYTGWSDANPITDETCTHRYGEAYYGPEGGDFHNTELLVTDTWWHQAATQLGADILMSNAGNSTGLLCASYPSNPDWDQYLKEMLAYKSRPYYLGKDGKNPDIIALYIGSNELARAKVTEYGSIENVDFGSLITDNGDGTYTYKTPVTVAESYCILLHKISVTYPDAEVYCFTVVPSAGGGLTTVNTRLANAPAFNEMIKGVAEHHGAIVVDLYEEFAIDPDGDGVAVQADYERFAAFYHNDPHPNAAGFDVITKCFVDTVMENSKYVVEVETTAGQNEFINVNVVNKDGKTIRTANKFVTGNGMLVDYMSELIKNGKESEYKDSYTSQNKEGTYLAEGGKEKSVKKVAPLATVQVPLFKRGQDSPSNSDSAKGRETGLLSTTGDEKNSTGKYNYTQFNVVEQGSVTVTSDPIKILQQIREHSYKGLDYTRATVDPTDENILGLQAGDSKIADDIALKDLPDEFKNDDKYGYMYVGSDTYSKYKAAFAYRIPKPAEDDESSSDLPLEPPSYKDDKRTFYVWDPLKAFHDRKLLVSNMFLKDETIRSKDGKIEFPARWDDVQQFVLTDKSGKTMTAYCADKNTNAHKGFKYNLYNLEEASYYSNTEARMIRVIAENGYWGTETGVGSLATIKSDLKNTGKFTEEEIARLTDGMALIATQYAIWTFSNVMDEVEFFNAYEKINGTLKEANQEDVALIFKYYHYLINLQPKATLEMKSTQKMVINESNFLEKVTITVKEKIADHKDNLDNNDKNDAYLVDISFKLGVQPNDGDSLVLKITSGDKTVATGRIAGTPANGEIVLKADGDGVYTFENLEFNEGKDNFQFRLQGDQRLEKAAQLFLSELGTVDGEETYSQPLVSLMSGKRAVNALMDITFDLQVEDELLSKEHVWRIEKPIPPKDEPEVPKDEPEIPKDEPKVPSTGAEKEPMDITSDLQVEDELLSKEHVWRIEKPIPPKDEPKVPLTGHETVIFYPLMVITGCLAAVFFIMSLKRRRIK